MDDGLPVFSYNYLGLEQTTIRGTIPLPEGDSEIVFDFLYDGGDEVGLGGDVTIRVNGAVVGRGHVERTQPFVMSTESTGVGHDGETPVVPDYGAAPDNHFHGGTLGAIRITRS